MSVLEGTLLVKDSADISIEVGSHYVRLTDFDERGKEALFDFCRDMAQYVLERLPNGKFRRVMSRVFVGVDKKRTFFHFHRHQLEDILNHLKRYSYTEKNIHIEYLEIHEGEKVEFKVIDKRTPRDDQEKFIAYVCNDQMSNIVMLDPGRGKTFITLVSMSILKVRTTFIIKPMYVEKWISDIKESFKISNKDLVVVRGGKDLKTYTQLAYHDLIEAKIIIISSMTYLNYLKDYEAFGEDILRLGYGCVPQDLMPLSKTGFVVVDEVHENPHFNYRANAYTHVNKFLGLSGSFESDDPFINKIYNILFPNFLRIDNGKRDVYVEVKALEYRFYNNNKIRHMNFARKSYSHIIFEQSLLKKKERLTRYIEMINSIVHNSFIKEREEGQKMIVYCATVDLCTKVNEYLTFKYPNLKVQRYTSDDSYEDMIKSDLIISTLKSLGTAIDVPGLKVVLLTDAIKSSQANIQCIGRLRRLKEWPDVTPLFIYLVNIDIDKHIEYHKAKVETFKNRVLSHKVLTTNFKI